MCLLVIYDKPIVDKYTVDTGIRDLVNEMKELKLQVNCSKTNRVLIPSHVVMHLEIKKHSPYVIDSELFSDQMTL